MAAAVLLSAFLLPRLLFFESDVIRFFFFGFPYPFSFPVLLICVTFAFSCRTHFVLSCPLPGVYFPSFLPYDSFQYRIPTVTLCAAQSRVLTSPSVFYLLLIASALSEFSSNEQAVGSLCLLCSPFFFPLPPSNVYIYSLRLSTGKNPVVPNFSWPFLQVVQKGVVRPRGIFLAEFFLPPFPRAFPSPPT